MPTVPDGVLDAVVIGGGPAGATTAALLARQGFHVALFERSGFPRFHVGESLVPAVNPVLERLGVLDRMDAAGFPRKHGVQFYSHKGPSRPFYFSEAENPAYHSTWQVLRSDFDALLVDAARESGAHCVMDAEVVGFETIASPVSGIRVRSNGDSDIVRARIVIDASGQKSLLSHRVGSRADIEGLENAAVFSHFEGVHLDSGIDAGSTLIFKIASDAWLWLIPLPNGVTSIGLVAPAKALPEFGATPVEMLEKGIAASPHLSERMESAHAIMDPRVARDFTYICQKDAGHGWALVGDALAFIDPVYSTGLFMTLLSAELVAESAATTLRAGGPTYSLEGYARRHRQAFNRFLPLVRAFYTEGFRFGPLAEQPRKRQGLVDLLIGDVESPAAVEVASTIEQLLVD